MLVGKKDQDVCMKNVFKEENFFHPSYYQFGHDLTKKQGKNNNSKILNKNLKHVCYHSNVLNLLEVDCREMGPVYGTEDTRIEIWD